MKYVMFNCLYRLQFCRELSHYVNSLAPERVQFYFYIGTFSASFSEWWLRYLLWNRPQMNSTRPYWWLVNIGSGNGVVPSGTKPLPEKNLTEISVGIWRQWVNTSGNIVIQLENFWPNDPMQVCISWVLYTLRSKQKDHWVANVTSRHIFLKTGLNFALSGIRYGMTPCASMTRDYDIHGVVLIWGNLCPS